MCSRSRFSWLSLITGPITVSVIVRVADLQAADPVDKPVDELVVDLRVDDQSIGRHADLALVQELAEDGRVDGEAEVGVVEDDGRAVPAQLEGHAS